MKLLLVALFGFGSAFAYAKLDVIRTYSNAMPIPHEYRLSLVAQKAVKEHLRNMPWERIHPVPLPILPIETPLQSGRLNEPLKIKNMPPLSSPIFIVGTDDNSYRWLNFHAARLKEINAFGVVVRVDDWQSLRYLMQLGRGLRLLPMHNSQQFFDLGIRHYPVLISSTYVEQ